MTRGADLDGRRVAVTGASSGIGEATAEAFAREGCRVAVAARSLDALQAVAKEARRLGAPDARATRVDVTDPSDLEAWAAELVEAWGGVDVVVANVGVGQYGAFLDQDAEDLERVVETNLLGAWRTVRAFADPLVDAGGRVVAVSSMISDIPTPYMSAYVATKAALSAWARSVRPEMARRGIGVTLVSPGATRTGFAANVVTPTGPGDAGLAARMRRGWPADRVAKRIVQAVRRGRDEVAMTATGRLGRVLGRLAPDLTGRLVEPRMRPEEE